jgi:hypothetical protein
MMAGRPPWLEGTEETLSRGSSGGDGAGGVGKRSSATDSNVGKSVVEPDCGCWGGGGLEKDTASNSECRRMSLSLAMTPRRRRKGMVAARINRHNPWVRRRRIRRQDRNGADEATVELMSSGRVTRTDNRTRETGFEPEPRAQRPDKCLLQLQGCKQGGLVGRRRYDKCLRVWVVVGRWCAVCWSNEWTTSGR